MLAQVERLLQENKLCVLCTAGENKPHCSLMTYMPGEDPRVLYMVASRESKKYQNMLGNPDVSLLIDNRKGLGLEEQKISAVSLSGIYQLVDSAELVEIGIKFTKMYPELAEIINNPSSALFAVKLQSFLFLAGPVDSYKGDFFSLPPLLSELG
ncbi:MAG: pyridoxamine 5'-phosphate oxidase family protein [Clostridia bacterium]